MDTVFIEDLNREDIKNVIKQVFFIIVFLEDFQIWFNVNFVIVCY